MSLWMFHITPAFNVPSIVNEGLLPMLGERARSFGEEEAFVPLFVSCEIAELCFADWMADWFENDDAIALLAVNIDGRLDVCESLDDPHEARASAMFEPNRIRVLSSNIAKIANWQSLVQLKLAGMHVTSVSHLQGAEQSAPPL